MADPLETLHQQIDDLTDPDGAFAVVCPLSGKRPVPVRGKWFPSAEAADEAVDLVVKYRGSLREVDPHLENVPIVACERTPEPLSLETPGDRDRRGNGDVTLNGECDWNDVFDAKGDFDRRWRDVSGNGNARRPTQSVTLSGDGDEAWLRMDDAPVVRVREDGEPIDDAAVERQLNANL